MTRIPASDVDQELAQSKAQIEAQLNQAVTSLAYPYGHFNDQTVAAAQAAGFTSAVIVAYGRNRMDADLFRLKRVAPPDQDGLQLRFGLQLRASMVGETLRQVYNWLA